MLKNGWYDENLSTKFIKNLAEANPFGGSLNTSAKIVAASAITIKTSRNLNNVTVATNSAGRFDGVRQLSQTLQDAGVSRSSRVDIINSFREGSINARQATGNENLLRFFGGDANDLGRFNPQISQGSARNLLALPPNNTATGLTQFNLRPGATFFEGTVAPNFGKAGGGTQVFVPNLNDLIR